MTYQHTPEPRGKITPQRIKKFIVALVGFLVLLIGAITDYFGDWIDDDWELWLASAVAFLTSLGVYQIPNEPMPGVVPVQRPGTPPPGSQI